LNRYTIYLQNKKRKSSESKIVVDEISSQVASLYERIRKVVDWKEEHLMRRIAIERVIKRRLFLKKKVENLAEPLVLELIRGGHFPNNFIEKSKIQKVQSLIERYSFILNHHPALPKGKTTSQFYSQIFKIAACEVEELLNPPSYQKVDILISYMRDVMRKRIVIGQEVRKKTKIQEREKDILIYIAVQQALIKLDKPIITYNLLKRYYPGWFRDDEESIRNINQRVHLILKTIDHYLSHPLIDKFYNICEMYDTPFLLLGDVVFKNSAEFAKDSLSQPKVLKKLIQEAYEARLSTLKKRMYRSALYSTISVFLTNVFSLYIIEIPFTKFVTGHFNLISSLVDIFVPTFLMALLVFSIKLPPKNNFDLIMNEVNKIVYGGYEETKCEVELYPGKSFILKIIFGFLYLLSFIICLGAIIFFLYKIHFPILSYFIFIIFTSLILFTGSLIRKRARELHMTKEKEGLLSFIIDPFTLPIIYFGKWLSSKWQKYNIVGVFFVILIDSPFVLFVEFLEQWRYFLREKKERIH